MLSHSTGMALKEAFLWICLIMAVVYTSIIMLISWLINRYCKKCGNKIKIYDKIPIISYIILGGCCRYCDRRINPIRLIIEIVVMIPTYFFLWGAWSCFNETVLFW